jgi:hypothetical protein
MYTIDKHLELNHTELEVIRQNTGTYWRCFCHVALSKTFHNPLATPYKSLHLIVHIEKL